MGLFAQTAASMVAGTLYTYPDNFRAQKAVIAAKYSGAQLTVAKDFVFGETNKSPEFLKKFPLGKVPAFEGADGLCLTESNAIAYYVANDELRGGSDAAARAQVVQWMCMADNEILPASCTWVFPTMGIMQFNKNATDRAKEDIKAALKTLNDHLLTRTYLVGERVTLADITVACTLLNLYKMVMDNKFRKGYAHTNRWFNTIVNQPEFKKVAGDVELCTKAAQPDFKKLAELANKKSDKGGKKSGKKGGKKGGGDAKPAQKKKAKEPSYPETTMSLDAFKKLYSNEDTRTVALPGFWEMYDPNGYSLWHCEYKYNSDLTLPFMASNLVGGWFQRLSKLHKYGFASVVITGEPNALAIGGVWMFRGPEVHPVMVECDDSEHYTWRKLDHTNAADKKLLEDFWAWDGETFDGTTVQGGKVFK